MKGGRKIVYEKRGTIVTRIFLLTIAVVILFAIGMWTESSGGGLVFVKEKNQGGNNYLIVAEYDDGTTEVFKTTRPTWSLIEVNRYYSVNFKKRLWEKYPQITNITPNDFG